MPARSSRPARRKTSTTGRARNSSRASSAPATSSRARRSTTPHVDFAGVPLRCVGEPAHGRRRRRGVGPPARHPISAGAAAAGGQHPAGHGDAAGLSRRQPGLYGRGSRTARSCASSPPPATASRQGSAVWLHLPPERAGRCWDDGRISRNEITKKQIREDTHETLEILTPRRAGRLGRARRRSRLLDPCAVGGAAGDRGHAGADRGGEEGRQGRLVHLDRPAAVGADRQGVRGQISRHRRAGSSAPAPSACSSASARNMPASVHAVDVVNSSDAAHFIVWKREGMLAPYVPEDVAKFYPAEHKDAGRHCSPASASGSASSATTPTW